MNCFTFQIKSSEYLDGTLPDEVKKEFDDHLETCRECEERNQHFKLIISTLQNQPRLSLPANLRKSPLSRPLQKGQASRLALSRLEHIPWIARTLLEGVGIVILVLLGISSTPKIRALYEKKMDKNLNDFKESSHITEPLVEAPPPQPIALGSAGVAGSGTSSSEDEISGEDDAADTVHVGRSQLWRFILKTVSPDEMRPQIIKALMESGVPASAPGLAGLQVPGGIEFDLTLPQSTVPEIKHAMEKLAPPAAAGKAASPSGNENFTWYRIKSKRKLPEGTSQVVIWLSQPN